MYPAYSWRGVLFFFNIKSNLTEKNNTHTHNHKALAQVNKINQTKNRPSQEKQFFCRRTKPKWLTIFSSFLSPKQNKIKIIHYVLQTNKNVITVWSSWSIHNISHLCVWNSCWPGHVYGYILQYTDWWNAPLSLLLSKRYSPLSWNFGHFLSRSLHNLFIFSILVIAKNKINDN